MESLTKWLEQSLSSSPLVAIAVALAAGVLISFTPCVYPVLGPTVAFVGARAGGSRLKAFTLSLVYGLGMALMYAGLGAFAALTGRMFGQFTANSPWVQGFIGAVCLLMGLSMLDVFLVEMPSGLQSLYTKRFGGAYLNALVAGAIFALIPASCAAPVLLVILAFVAVGKNLLYGITLLFAFGIGVSVLVVLAGTFAGMLTAMPKSGAWMDKIKHGMGWVMLVLGAYFIFNAGRLSHSAEPVAPSTEVSLSDYRGKVVFVTFWASWCVACMEEVPELQRLHEKYGGPDFEIVAINAQETASKAISTAKNKNMPYQILLGPAESDVWENYHVLGIPENLLIDRSGVVAFRAGLIPEDVDERIERALADRNSKPDPSIQVGDISGKLAPDFTLPLPDVVAAQEAASEQGTASELEAATGDQVGMVAPDFTAPMADGTEVSLSDFPGSAVLLVFWATYQGGWGDNEPAVRRLHKQYSDDELVILAVNVGDDAVTVESDMKRRGMACRTLIGIDKPEIHEKYDTLDVPMFLLIDPSGVVVFRDDDPPEDIDERMAEMLQGDAP
jgi:cytochrome c-type biogenesis protein